MERKQAIGDKLWISLHLFESAVRPDLTTSKKPGNPRSFHRSTSKLTQQRGKSLNACSIRPLTASYIVLPEELVIIERHEY